MHPDLTTPHPGILTLTPLTVYKLHYTLAPNAPSNTLITPPFCFLSSFSSVLLTPFITKPDFSIDLTMLMISSFSSFKVSYVAIPNPKLLLCIPASAADATAANPNGVKTHLANDLSTFFIKGTPLLVMVLEVYLDVLLIATFMQLSFV